MSLDVYLVKLMPTTVYDNNITHNLIDMAQAADLYKCCWRPEEIGITKAEQLIEPLKQGIERLKAEPDGSNNSTPQMDGAIMMASFNG